MNNPNPLISSALQAIKNQRTAAIDLRKEEQRKWMELAVARTVAVAKRVLDIELNPDEVEVDFARRDQAIRCDFTVYGDSLDLHFVTFTEENVRDYAEAKIDLIHNGTHRINSLADLGAELERQGVTCAD